MTIFDVMGPVMVGPSSSHTAGAVRIGLTARRLLASEPVKADILLHGSFAATGAGHGTDRAIVAGLLGLAPDDPDIPRSLQLAKERGMAVHIRTGELRNAHPNTALVTVTNAMDRSVELSASSLGGGRIRINAIDGMEASFSGEYPTLIIRNQDRPGMLWEITRVLYEQRTNIATLQLYRDRKGGLAVTVIECDDPLTPALRQELAGLDGVVRYTYLNMTEGA